ncbi:DUF2291 domain-containing protein [Xinfangfangia sp. D13-10-4-6]|uniref:DUF2291 family protein n=1 Tax=Pseudogemmobacter hezensis TaxID=2737662 RepID=UPI0015526E87|nr:DUF2291 domain-containing protein [Pseudogemmobacter hezensis]
MPRSAFGVSVFCLALGLGLAGCKIVPDPDPNEAGATAAGQSDDERMQAYAADAWEPRVLPVIAGKRLPLRDLRQQLAADPSAAGAAHGLRPQGDSNPWNFAVTGEGVITGGKTDSRAAKLEVDTDGDGKGDLTIQLGPVIRGTAIRDAMPFVVFTDFRDQIEFAKLANAFNAEAHKRTPFPEGDIIGQQVQFEGVFTLQGKGEKIELVPTALSYGG